MEVHAKNPKETLEMALDAFFQALANHDMGAARTVIATLERMAEESDDEEFRAWAAYMATILDIETYHWDDAEARALTALGWTRNPQLRGRLYNELGILSDQLGRWEDAIQYYRTALALFQAVGDSIYEGKVRKNLGTALVRGVEAGALPRSALAEAEEQERQALALFKSLDIEPLAAATCNEMGAVYKAMERWEDARRCYERYGQERRAQGDAWGEGQALNNLAETFYAQGDLQRAINLWQRALPLVAGHFWDEVDVRIHLAQAHKRLGHLSDARVWSYSAIDLVESVRAGLSSADARMDFFALHQRPYQIAAGVALAQGNWQEALTLSERARARTFVEMLARRQDEARTPDMSEEAQSPLSAEAIMAQLPEDTGVLAYFETDDALIAMLVRKNALTIRQLPMPLHALAGASFDLRGRPRGLLTEDGRLGASWLFPKLGALLLQPLAQELSDIRTLWVIPYGILHHLPLTAMPVDAEGLLLEGWGSQVALAPSITVLFQKDWIGEKISSSRRRVFLGYDGDTLHHATLEASALAERWGGESMIGEDATLAALHAAWSRCDLLHLACPGVFRPDQPLESGVKLADGLAKVSQLFELPPARQRLVILSACETGRGQVRRGEEVVGLVRAWMYAGADGVLVSLWQVDDLATLLLMDAFHQFLQDASAARALAQAKRALRGWTLQDMAQRYRALGGDAGQWAEEIARLTHMWQGQLPEHPLDHPYFWAAFILHGNLWLY